MEKNSIKFIIKYTIIRIKKLIVCINEGKDYSFELLERIVGNLDIVEFCIDRKMCYTLNNLKLELVRNSTLDDNIKTLCDIIELLEKEVNEIE